jgi:hypothetical protein
MDSMSAAKSGLALAIARDGSMTMLILYSPKAFIARLREIVAEWEESGSEGGQRFPINRMFDAKGAVAGMVRVRQPPSGECYGALEVVNSAAEKGFGPMLYDIAMGLSPSHAITSDRNKVSKSAQGVWGFYKGKRGDVETLPFDDVDNPKTKPTQDDCQIHPGGNENPINYAYKGSSKVNVGALMANHKEFVRTLQHLIQSSKFPIAKMESIENTLVDAATDYFGNRYQEQGQAAQ